MNGVTPRRILMTADTVGGVWCYAVELIGALASYNVDVLLATMGARPSEAQREELACLSNVELAESSYKLEWMDEPWGDVEAAGDWLLELEERFRPDVIHLNGYAHGALPWRAPKIIAGHSCVLSWWKGVKGGHASAEWNYYREIVANGLRGADAVVAPTAAMRDCLIEHYGWFSELEVIPNGRRFDLFGKKSKESFILSAGRLWDEAKNVRAVCACSLPWPICVAGETQHPNGNAKAANLDQVRCLGKLSCGEMADWFGRASIYVLPARYEPFGLSVLEAALSECALVLGDIPSLRENWEDAALFVPPEDTDLLQETLLDLIEDGAERRELGKRARARAMQFDINLTAEKYMNLYSRVISSGRGQREEQKDYASV